MIRNIVKSNHIALYSQHFENNRIFGFPSNPHFLVTSKRNQLVTLGNDSQNNDTKLHPPPPALPTTPLPESISSSLTPHPTHPHCNPTHPHCNPTHHLTAKPSTSQPRPCKRPFFLSQTFLFENWTLCLQATPTNILV